MATDDELDQKINETLDKRLTGDGFVEHSEGQFGHRWRGETLLDLIRSKQLLAKSRQSRMFQIRHSRES